ncbi:uncharacterized protein LOC100178460 [Ciona intestinalis]
MQTSDASFNSYGSNNGTFLYTCDTATHIFTDAVELCEQANAQLAVVNTEEMLNGAHASNEYRWLDGSRFDSGQVGGRVIKDNETTGCVGVALKRPTLGPTPSDRDVLEANVCNAFHHVLCFTTQNISTITTSPETTIETTTRNPTSTKPITNGQTSAQPTPGSPGRTSTQATTDEQTAALPSSSPIQTWLIIVIAVGGILFLIFLVGIIYCCCCRKRNDIKTSVEIEDNQAGNYQTIEHQSENVYEIAEIDAPPPPPLPPALADEPALSDYVSMRSLSERAPDTGDGYGTIDQSVADPEAYSTLYDETPTDDSPVNEDDESYGGKRPMYASVNKSPIKESIYTVDRTSL